MADLQLGRDVEALTALANCRQVMAEYFKTSLPVDSEIESVYKYVAGIGSQFRNSFQTLGPYRMRCCKRQLATTPMKDAVMQLNYFVCQKRDQRPSNLKASHGSNAWDGLQGNHELSRADGVCQLI